MYQILHVGHLKYILFIKKNTSQNFNLCTSHQLLLRILTNFTVCLLFHSISVDIPFIKNQDKVRRVRRTKICHQIWRVLGFNACFSLFNLYRKRCLDINTLSILQSRKVGKNSHLRFK